MHIRRWLTLQLKIDLQYFAGEKTEKATPKKRARRTKRARVAKSQDVNTASYFIVSLFL